MTQDHEFGHTESRNRALRKTFVASAGYQAITVLGTLISLPFVTRALTGPEFGVVATLTGFQALVGLADLGTGSALTFMVADRRARADRPDLSALVAGSLVITGCCALLVLVIGYTAAAAVPWSSWLNTGAMPTREVALAVAAATTTIAVSIVGSVGYRLLFALQRGAAAGWAMLSATLLSAVATIVVANTAPRAFALILTMLAVPAVVSLLVTVHVVTRAEAGALRPEFTAASREGFSLLWRRSRWFWLISVAGAASFQTDTVIVAGLTSAATAGVYAIVLRLFGLVNQTIQPWILQLGPAFADALAREHDDWIRHKVVQNSILAALMSSGAGLILILVAPEVVTAWLTPDLAPSRQLLIPAALWTTAILTTEPMFLLLQAMGRLRFHAAVAGFMAVVNVGLSVWMTSQWGAAGPLWGSFISTILCAALPGYLAVRRTTSMAFPRVSASEPPT